MFKDARSKKIVLISHCILNQNAISDGTADFLATFETVVNRLVEEKVGLIQLPCPELMCLGLNRGDSEGSTRDVVVENTRIREELSKANTTEKIVNLVNNTIYQIEEYLKYDFKIEGIIGINRSPSCGVNTTSANNEEVNGKGVFMQMLKEELDKRNIQVEMVGIKTSFPAESLKTISDLIK